MVRAWEERESEGSKGERRDAVCEGRGEKSGDAKEKGSEEGKVREGWWGAGVQGKEV